jgi:SAM-dependent methyltransferase
LTNQQNFAERHLDLGCGESPRNPYRKSELYGVDLRLLPFLGNVVFKSADLSLEPIPFHDNFFSSVSAFDYLEHIPRVMASSDGKSTFFPFVRLMSEVWRVLAPGGRFYALTPAYPSATAFQDPTHVNFITAATHKYFCGDSPMANMYGFQGRFRVVRAEFVVHKDARVACDLSLRQKLRRIKYSLQGKLTHFLWELEAVKDY